MKKIFIAMIALATAFSGVVPAQAMPRTQQIEVQSDIAQVRDRRIIRRDRGFRNDRNWNRRHYSGRDWDRRGSRNWDRRYYGSNRRYYRDRGGYGIGVPLGAFAAGAIIGGALNSAPQRRSYAGNGHVSWCYDRYRSYRASDNTYQPYNGPRRQCYSR